MIFNRYMSGAIINRRWARTHDLWAMTHLLVLLCGLTTQMTAFRTFTKRLVTLWKHSGSKFLCAYLKEAVRMVIAFINHSLYTMPKASASVRKDRRGLPKIVPGVLRKSIVLARDQGSIKDILILRIVLTVLSFYRVLNFRAKPNLDSITLPFSGVGPSLPHWELEKVRTLFGNLRFGGFSWFISESAGPNGPKATWFSFVDCISFLYCPKIWASWLEFSLRRGHFALVLWFLAIQFLSLPFLPLLGVLITGRLGSLSALHEAAGKVRIVAITDWWSQAILRPLHLGIFEMLKLIGQDGTFDQWKAVETWVIPRLRLGSPCFSFDLSNATDRLPLSLQIDILSLFIGKRLSRLWGRLLQRDWWFQGNPIRYMVGQPMGAYSSWAMLALTHHFVVQLAALRAGWVGWFPYYALLGDDIVIADRAVAEHYLAIMRGLGVSISLHKSIVSESGLLEFAKRWYSGTRGELSALGPGLLLACVKNIYLLPVLLLQMFQRNWLHFPTCVDKFIGVASKVRRDISPKMIALMIATTLGPSGLLKASFSQVTACADLWFSKLTGQPAATGFSVFEAAYAALVISETRSEADVPIRELKLFLTTWWKWPILRLKGFRQVAGILSIPTILIAPGFWIYLVTLVRGLRNLFVRYVPIDWGLNPNLVTEGGINFSLLRSSDLCSISWKRRKEVKREFELMRKLQDAVDFEISQRVRQEQQWGPKRFGVSPSHPTVAVVKAKSS